ncbi:MAG: hypothetical protein LKK19_00140 [Bacteroidales bacterium]|jgi:hypothetical protein|nr:hypothetical protein [Bacteroidales bacterium]MCI2121102.1 hypothetical protein [Bacteroidales bacterium]MCI2144917.1 hypothetical protein [Bacteroidales bacterium]
MKKYITRAVKYLLYFILIFAVIVLILYLIREDRTQTLKTMFQPGAFWKISILFVIIAAVYPAIGFKKMRFDIKGGLDANRDKITEALDGLNYVKTESTRESPGSMCFRCKGGGLRLSRMNEDGVTISSIEGSDEIEIEGLRREVLTVIKALDEKFSEQ